MYDEEISPVSLTSDEVNILKGLLFHHLDTCVSLGEELTVKNLLDKMSEI